MKRQKEMKMLKIKEYENYIDGIKNKMNEVGDQGMLYHVKEVRQADE